MRVLKIVLTLVFFIFSLNNAMAKSFTDYGTSAVTDNDTGLIWQKWEGGVMVWESGLGYCERLTMGGKTNWRLPNLKELQSLVDYSHENPALDTTYFPSVVSRIYWASTTTAHAQSIAWVVDFSDGSINHSSKTSVRQAAVRCVRGGQ